MKRLLSALLMVIAVAAFNMPLEIIRPRFLNGMNKKEIKGFDEIMYDKNLSFNEMLNRFRVWAKEVGVESEIDAYISLHIGIDNVSDRFYSALVRGLSNYFDIVQVALSNHSNMTQQAKYKILSDIQRNSWSGFTEIHEKLIERAIEMTYNVLELTEAKDSDY
ncbi:hypothetical protein PRIPAC_76140 [Pristionchus pacificus]|uniref:Uncharacterized protein n=1 Tax=Pristionchus pacificus TaxID=54126 RepID=A0A2A6D0N2_PRIPA|nr:hypothetical protein PRIPAC_76140 [Pristionchus pacificus]|eukprot:PDM83877.1 hypothetical protein PRIPAC_30364 [Pristionchus pacificus]